MRWHHIVSLAGGVISVTWIFSGLLSMNPFDVFSPRGAQPQEREAWSGTQVVTKMNPARVLALARRGERRRRHWQPAAAAYTPSAITTRLRPPFLAV